jgi:malonate decarboxylase delta subunit
MEKMKFEYDAKEKITMTAHVGGVSSGDLEIIFSPAENLKTTVEIITCFDGNQKIWKSVLDRFFDQHSIAAEIKINDFGATPGLVNLRLLQGLEESMNETRKE